MAAATLAVGQNLDSGTYACYRLFFSFDTSGVDDAHGVVSPAFYAKASSDSDQHRVAGHAVPLTPIMPQVRTNPE